jgi:aminoglycoside phosphotransferase (APT) family kinase protein
MIPIDEPAPIRAGEELDISRLQGYLASHLADVAGPVSVAQFPHGHSNLTYLVHAGDREWVLRRPPVGNPVKTAHDMGREFKVLSKLCEVYPPAPRPFVYCDDASVVGAPFYLMERRRGVILRAASAPGLGASELQTLCEALVDNLAVLHALDYGAAGLAELGKPEGYVERQVRGWSERYRNAQTDPLAAMDEVATWLDASRPAESGSALVHNDYKFDNVVFDPTTLGRIVAVIDWEMCTVGDPLMDFGTTLAYWVEPADPGWLKHLVVGPTSLPGCLSRGQVAERYLERTGRGAPDLLFYYVFGLFKIAVIVQQIYARYARGHTRDERFARLQQAVSGLSQAARAAIDAGRF